MSTISKCELFVIPGYLFSNSDAVLSNLIDNDFGASVALSVDGILKTILVMLALTQSSNVCFLPAASSLPTVTFLSIFSLAVFSERLT